MSAVPATPNYLALIRDGLAPRASTRRTVIVVGAGMAGLVAAEALLRAGHQPVVLEAQARVGGRIYTLRAPFSDGLYAEAGAMRIPRAHRLTLAYIERFGLPTAPFSMGNPAAYWYLHGQRHRAAEATADPDRLGFAVAPHERGKSAGQLWEEAVRPFVARLQTEGQTAWPAIVEEYDHYSTREFLEASGWSEDAIEMFGLLANEETRLNSSFVELLREEVGQVYLDMARVEGGMDHLPRAFVPLLRERLRFGARVLALEQTPTGVTAHYQTVAGRARVDGDYLILTLPFAVVRHIEVLPAFSRAKQRVIRQLPYDAAAKIFFQCRRRFWEEEDGIIGGGTITDLPIRSLYYPEHGRETGRGVLLASYTFAEDAQRWGSLSPTDRVAQALENVAKIHPRVLEEFEVGASQIWHDDEFAGGAFAVFHPGQERLLYPHIIAPEGRIHFAGEHTSLAHGWIQGAIESGLRAALEVHQAGD